MCVRMYVYIYNIYIYKPTYLDTVGFEGVGPKALHAIKPKDSAKCPG